jgi:hypothetical protein
MEFGIPSDMNTNKRSIRIRQWMAAVLLALLSVFAAHAATVVFVTSSTPGQTLEPLRMAAQFYGLDVVFVSPADGTEAVLHAALRPDVVALVIDAAALTKLDSRRLLERGNHALPVLIAGITDDSAARALPGWSDRAVRGATRLEGSPKHLAYRVANIPAIVHELAGEELPLQQSPAAYLQLGSGSEAILNFVTPQQSRPIFAHARVRGHDVYFSTRTGAVAPPRTPDPNRQQIVFAGMAPELFFLRSAAGDQAWHTTGSYANFTIDDLWLREPYGAVDYAALLHEMEVHHFHTTIAFIPWNYDRSEPGVVSLIASHPDRYSLCIHGNDHVHQEFGPVASHPLEKQTADLRQAVARMERFRQLTGLPYDRIMVFPHSIAPTPTLAELKKANYLATANSLNVPSDAEPGLGVNSVLRTTTLEYANFPSMRRYSAEAEIAEPQLAIDAFLGNPILLYGHQGFFANGLGAFDSSADLVNRIAPHTEWRSLGYIAAHSYLQRRRSDGNYDIQIQAPIAELTNSEERDATFFLSKEDDFALPVKILVDGAPVPSTKQAHQLQASITLRPKQICQVRILYGEDLPFTTIDVGKLSWHVWAIRQTSDLRDNVISRSKLGRRFVRSYTEKSAIWQRWAMAAILGFIAVLLLMRSSVRARFKRQQGRVSDLASVARKSQ